MTLPGTSYCSHLIRKGNIAIPCGQVLVGGVCPIHGIATEKRG